MTKQIPEHYKTVQWVLDNKCPNLKAQLMLKENFIKQDGSIDEIQDRDDKDIKRILDYYINIKAQRVDEINETNILTNLEREEGFSHEEAGTISHYEIEKYGITSCPNGMHRLLMGLLCGVEEISSTLERRISEEYSDEQITKIEGKFLRAQNSHNAHMSTAESNKKDKESGNMSDRQKQYDQIFTTAGIHVHGYGVEADEVNPTYIDTSHEDWYRHLSVTSATSFIGTDDFNIHSKNVLIKYGTGNKAVDIPISWICANLSSHIKFIFIKWLGTIDFKQRDLDWWWKHNMHCKAFETTVVRLLCAFNEHYRGSYDKNLITMDTIPFLHATSVETKHFVDNCLDKGISIDSADVKVKSSTVIQLNSAFNAS